MPFRSRICPSALVFALALACATPALPPAQQAEGAADNRVASGFPEPEVLEQLERQPSSGDLPFRTRFRDVDVWALEGPFPDTLDGSAPRSGERAWDPLLDDLVRARVGLVVATAGMECFAREVGRFAVEHDVLPGLGLQRFMAARCAVATAPPQLARFWWASPRLRSVDAGVDELREQIAERLRGLALGGPADVGAWIHVSEGRLHLLVAQGQRVLRVDPVSTLPGPDSTLTLTGEVLVPAVQISALVTRGRLGWSECDAREDLALPRFQFTCRVDPADRQAWMSVQFLPPGSILARGGLQLLAHPGGDEASSYRRHAYVSPRRVESDEELPRAFLELLNEVRHQAGAPPLELEAAQSEAATELAPHYFEALTDPAREPIAQLVALGMMAGWEVQDIVQEGRFVFMWLVESRDVASLLSDALDHPASRMVLLDAELERIAVGPMAGGQGEMEYLALIASTYKLFSESEHRDHAERVYERLAVARVERTRLTPRSLDPLQPLAVAAASRVQAGEAPNRVLADLIQQSVDTLGRSVSGWLGETQDLDALVFPEDFLERRQLDVAIAVAFHKPPGEPWGRYVVLMVAAEPERRGT